MTRLAIVEPRTLVGEAVRNAITASGLPYQSIELFTDHDEEVGAVTEVAGGAALVQKLQEGSLQPVDTVIFCGRELKASVLDRIPGGVRAIFIDPADSPPDAVVAVAGVSDAESLQGRRVTSPSPAVILLAHLLAPLRPCAPLEVVAHLLLPASAHDHAGIDELFAQTRSILSLSDDRPIAVFGGQLAFNLLPWPESSERLVADLDSVIGGDLESHLHLSQSGVFHCLAASVLLRLQGVPSAPHLLDLILQNPRIEAFDEAPLLGPVSAASNERILLGSIEASGVDRYWLWCVVDNLTASAHNALALAR